jgi:pimeloyl-ACP methyl ester carboxylesterase
MIGHSFGGYLAGCYSLKHPEHVNALIFADPWGLPRRTAEDAAKAAKMSWRWRLAKNILQNFSPLAAIRVAGPYGTVGLLRSTSCLSARQRVSHIDIIECLIQDLASSTE